MRTPAATSYLRRLAAAQRTLQSRITARIPNARFHWRYGIVVNGFSVVVPRDELARLESTPGVAKVYPSVRYGPSLDRSPQAIKANVLWAPGLASAGDGIKIGIVDDGVNQTHPFFDPGSYQMPPGFPKGQTAFTTAKVIVARAFAPATPRWRHASKPFDPLLSEHATHVAGIAAGNNGTRATGNRAVSGVAPRAYIGNYKALTVPTQSGAGLNGNSPELAAAIEAAVRDGMDVINLSLGEPEIEPSRDLVVQAIDAAADAGVVPVVAAGNDYVEFGSGSVLSPGSAAKAITAGAVAESGAADIAEFSAGGPTPVSHLLKPDVTAPGVAILSSVPAREGSWDRFTGTSMAAPHAAGGAALLLQRHPTWSVAQVKSALVTTGAPVGARTDPADEEPPTREGGGMLDLQKADVPLVFAEPAGLGLGLVRRSVLFRPHRVALADAGGGAGTWSVTVERREGAGPAMLQVPASVTVPGVLDVGLQTVGARLGEQSGFVVLTRGAERRRIPYWFRVTAPRLGAKGRRALSRPGVHTGDTRKASARVRTYRYPDDPSVAGVARDLAGPEQVFRVTLRRPAANFGFAVLSRGRRVAVEPRIVRAGDENELVGQTALPLNVNPYLTSFRTPRPIAGLVRPARGSYDVVFDSPTKRGAGRYTFRFWVNDTRPPTLRLLTGTVGPTGVLRVRATDAGAGVDDQSIVALVDRERRLGRFDRSSGIIRIPAGDLSPGTHRLVLQVSDHQETKNMENVERILPNTRTLTVTFRVR